MTSSMSLSLYLRSSVHNHQRKGAPLLASTSAAATGRQLVSKQGGPEFERSALGAHQNQEYRCCVNSASLPSPAITIVSLTRYHNVRTRNVSAVRCVGERRTLSAHIRPLLASETTTEVVAYVSCLQSSVFSMLCRTMHSLALSRPILHRRSEGLPVSTMQDEFCA